jgi:hypothetical protein
MSDQPNTLDLTKQLERAAAPTQMAVVQKEPNALAPQTWFRGVPPEDKLNRMYGFAKAICHAAFISPVVRGDEASVFYLVSMAEDLGLQWTHGLRSIYPLVKRGKSEDGSDDQIRAGIQGDIAMALLLGRKFKVKIVESTEEVCTIWMERPDGLMSFQDSFTIAEAGKLGLLGKPNWAYRKDMLRWRAVMRVARIVAADVLGGMHLPDELDEEAEERAEPGRDENPFKVTAAPQAQISPSKEAAPASKEPLSDSKATDAPPTPLQCEPHAFKGGADGHVCQVCDKGPEEAWHTPVQSGAPEPAKTEKRRGRPPKAEQTAEQALAEQKAKQASDSPESVPKSDFKASDDDLPAEMGAQVPASLPTAAPTKTGPQLVHKPELGQLERIQAVDAVLATELKRDVDVCRKAVRQWLASFLGVGTPGKLPRPGSTANSTPSNPLLDGAIAVLESCARQYGAAMFSDPVSSGTQAGAGWGKFVRDIDQWPDDLKALAKTVAIQRHPDSADDLLAFLSDVAHLTVPDREMWTFLQIYRISQAAPMKLREAAAVQKTTMEAICKRITGDPITEQAVLSAIAGVQTGAQAEGTLWNE